MKKQTYFEMGDPDVILATRKYVDEAIQKIHEKFAQLDSPTFIGAPNAPTPEQNNNSEQLATTAFVQTVQEITGKRYVTPEQGDERYWKRDDKLFPDMENGYQVLPSGLILQWGRANLPTGGGDWVNLPIAFPNEIMQVCLTCNGTACYPCSVNFEPGRTTGFIAFGLEPVSHQYAHLPVYWFAIGN